MTFTVLERRWPCEPSAGSSVVILAAEPRSGPDGDSELGSEFIDKFIPVTMAEGSPPFPFRTRPLSPPAPMVLPGKPGGRVGRCRDFFLTHP